LVKGEGREGGEEDRQGRWGRVKEGGRRGEEEEEKEENRHILFKINYLFISDDISERDILYSLHGIEFFG
jgi:hypothetical protein